jgi:hypothetical protein
VARGVGSDVEVGPDDAPPIVRSRFILIRDWLRSALFLSTAPRPTPDNPSPRGLTVVKVLAAIVAVAAGAWISLLRTTGPGALNTTWIEDARDLLSQAYLYPFGHLLTVPLNGYWEDTGRVATQIAIQFPVTWQPGVMSVIAASLYSVSGLIAYVASGPHLRHPLPRLLVAAPCVMIPLGYTQANNDLATMQFVMLYGVFWALLWVPSTIGGKIAAALFMPSVAANMLVDMVYAPLVVARLIADRSKAAIAVCSIWLIGVCVQWYPSLSGMNSRLNYGHNSLTWVGWQYLSEAVPRALFGEKALGGPGADTKTIGLTLPNYQITPAVHLRLALIAWAVLVVALILARIRLTSPNWALVGTALLSSLIVLEGELAVNVPVLEPRYIICPALLIYTALVAALRPRAIPQPRAAGSQPAQSPPAVSPPAEPGPSHRRPAQGRRPADWLLWALSWLPVTGVSVLVAFAITANFLVVNGRSTNKPWTTIIAITRAECARHGAGLPPRAWVTHGSQYAYIYWYLWYKTTIPCSRVS